MANLRLRAIGSSPSVQRPGRACSAYLVRTPDAAVLLDAGSGAIGSLQLAMDYTALDAIVVSHMHADHFLDLLPLRYGLTYGPRRRATRLPVWLPPRGQLRLQAIGGAFDGEDGEFFGEVFEVREYDPMQSLIVNNLRLSFARTLHYVESYAIRAEHGDVSVTYSGDTAPCHEVVALACCTTLFVCEVTLALESETPPRGHSSAREAGAMARRANVGRLALTHYYADADPQALAAAASAEFSGPVTVVDDGTEFEL